MLSLNILWIKGRK